MLQLLSLFLLLSGGGQNAASAALPAPPVAAVSPDSVSSLTRAWVLREKLVEGSDLLEPVIQLDSMELVFYPDKTYRITMKNATPNIVNGPLVEEFGKWKLNTEDGMIGVSVTNVNGKAILSAMLYRWQIEELGQQQLVLRQYGAGRQYLIFDAKR